MIIERESRIDNQLPSAREIEYYSCCRESGPKCLCKTILKPLYYSVLEELYIIHILKEQKWTRDDNWELGN